MELLVILVVVALVGFWAYKNFSAKADAIINVSEVAAKAEVVEAKAETKPAKKSSAKRAPAKKSSGTKKSKTK